MSFDFEDSEETFYHEHQGPLVPKHSWGVPAVSVVVTVLVCVVSEHTANVILK